MNQSDIGKKLNTVASNQIIICSMIVILYVERAVGSSSRHAELFEYISYAIPLFVLIVGLRLTKILNAAD